MAWLRSILTAALLLAASGLAFGQTESVLYTFQGQPDGYFPESSLVIGGAGNLYGTTTYGGGGACYVDPYSGCGFIYELVPPAAAGSEWTEIPVWRFQGGTDGGNPGGLLTYEGQLWGVAGAGGTGPCTGGCGYFFRLEPPSSPEGAWTKVVVFDFPGPNYFCRISAVDTNGNFYGTGLTSQRPDGYVCELQKTQSGYTTIDLYDFQGVPKGRRIGDGSYPISVAFDAQGNLWGAAADGGYCQPTPDGSCFGALFELKPPAASSGEWSETVVYRFPLSNANPTSPVTVDPSGAVFGLTSVQAYKYLDGRLTKITDHPGVPPFGAAPTGGLVLDRDGNVYGTMGAGGAYGYGTVYELLAPDYTPKLLYSFAGGADGSLPCAPMIFGPDGVLYGTTQTGGNQGCQLGFGGIGCGTVFQLVP